MSTTTKATTAKKTPAKKAAPAKVTPAKATPEKATAAKKAGATAAAKVAEKHAFEATGRGGKINIRTYPTADIQFAVDVADPEAKTEAGRKGLIYRMFSSREKAEEFAAKHNAAGSDAIVVAARAVR